MGNSLTYCSLCGAPMLESGTLEGKPEVWLTQAALLTTAYESERGLELQKYRPAVSPTSYCFQLISNPVEDLRRSVLRLDARSNGTNVFDIVESGEQVEVMHIGIQRGTPGLIGGAPLYLPIHLACLHLVDRFIDSADTSAVWPVPEEGVTSSIQLWEVLYRRLCGRSAGVVSHIVTEPHDYFGGRRCRNVYWEPEDDPDYGKLLEQNPDDIPNLTQSILENLKQKATTHQDIASKEGISNQDWFCEATFNKQLLPWLWDLEPGIFRQWQSSGEWDWELLLRQLFKKKIHEPNDETLRLPLQLRNRRRIWRLLEEARVGDVEKKEKARLAARLDEKERISASSKVTPAKFQVQSGPGFGPPGIR